MAFLHRLITLFLDYITLDTICYLPSVIDVYFTHLPSLLLSYSPEVKLYYSLSSSFYLYTYPLFHVPSVSTTVCLSKPSPLFPSLPPHFDQLYF